MELEVGPRGKSTWAVLGLGGVCWFGYSFDVHSNNQEVGYYWFVCYFERFD